MLSRSCQYCHKAGEKLLLKLFQFMSKSCKHKAFYQNGVSGWGKSFHYFSSNLQLPKLVGKKMVFHLFYSLTSLLKKIKKYNLRCFSTSSDFLSFLCICVYVFVYLVVVVVVVEWGDTLSPGFCCCFLQGWEERGGTFWASSSPPSPSSSFAVVVNIKKLETIFL